MDILNELNEMLDDFNNKKDILDNHTKTITKEMREWCINENNRILCEREKIRNFVYTNKCFILKKLGVSGRYIDYTTYKGFGLSIRESTDGKFGVGLDSDYCYRSNIGNWTKLRKPNGYVCIPDKNGVNQYDFNNNTLDYWTDVKRSLAIRNEELTHLVNNLKRLLHSLIDYEDMRFEELRKNYKDIIDNEVFEINITMRKCI